MINVKLQEILEEKGKTLYWLSQATELTYPTIHRLASNKTTSINFETLERVCIALECDICDLLKIESK